MPKNLNIEFGSLGNKQLQKLKLSAMLLYAQMLEVTEESTPSNQQFLQRVKQKDQIFPSEIIAYQRSIGIVQVDLRWTARKGLSVSYFIRKPGKSVAQEIIYLPIAVSNRPRVSWLQN